MMAGVIDDGFDAIVLAGGDAQRLGGVDKPMLEIGGTPLLHRVLDAVAGARRRVVVGPARDLGVEVVACRESPPGGGPVAALAAGLPHTSAPTVVVLAADLPGIAPAIGPLRAAARGNDVAMLVADGRVNYLAAAWRRATLATELARLERPEGVPMRSLVANVTPELVEDDGNWGADCDTWADLARIRAAYDDAAR